MALISVGSIHVSLTWTGTLSSGTVGPGSYLTGVHSSGLFSSTEHLAFDPAIVEAVAGVGRQDGDVHLLQSAHIWAI